jgi:hypothetical protein
MSTTATTNTPAEILFHATESYKNPFMDITLDVEFTDPTGVVRRVPAFWAGKNEWRVRYASPITGSHNYRTICNPVDNGLHGIEGSVEITAYSGDNPLYKHGPINIAKDKRHFQHQDGTPFLWLADTWWKALSKRLTWEGFQELCEDRRSKGFNTVQIVCGPYPDETPFSEGWDNEGGTMYADEAYTQVNTAYFDYADRRLALLVESGLMPALVGAWGRSDCDAMKIVGVDGLKRHWRYLVARYAASPLILVPGGEVPGVAKYGEGDWGEVVSYLCEIDPFKRIKTSHEYACPARDDAPLNDFEFVGGSHFEPMSAGTLNIFTDRYGEKPTMPLVCGETGYEGHMQRHFADTQRHVFWMYMLNGAAGHTYGSAGLHHMGVEGDLGLSPVWDYAQKRDSPLLNGEGVALCAWDYTTWQEAKDFPGATQVGLGRRLLEAYPWDQFEVHPEWSEEACYSAGIPGELRLIYRPNGQAYDWTPPRIRDLEMNVPYRGTYVDPVKGRRFDIGAVMRVSDHPAPFQSHEGETIFEEPLEYLSDWEMLSGTQGDVEFEGVATTSGHLKLSNRVLHNKTFEASDFMGSVEVSTGGHQSAGIVLGYKNINNHIVAFYDRAERAICFLNRRGGRFSYFRRYIPMKEGLVETPNLKNDFKLSVAIQGHHLAMKVDDGEHSYHTPVVRIPHPKGQGIGLWQGGATYRNLKISETVLEVPEREKSDMWLLRNGEDWAPPIPSPQDWLLVLERSNKG